MKENFYQFSFFCIVEDFGLYGTIVDRHTLYGEVLIMQSSGKIKPLPSIEVLMGRFRPYIENKGLMHYRNRTSDRVSSLPANVVGENEDEVAHNFMLEDDESGMIESFMDRLADEDGS